MFKLGWLFSNFFKIIFFQFKGNLIQNICKISNFNYKISLSGLFYREIESEGWVGAGRIIERPINHRGRRRRTRSSPVSVLVSTPRGKGRPAGTPFIPRTERHRRIKDTGVRVPPSIVGAPSFIALFSTSIHDPLRGNDYSHVSVLMRQAPRDEPCFATQYIQVCLQ